MSKNPNLNSSADRIPTDNPFSTGSYLSATGKIRYTIINDYMFKIIFQHEENLKGLLCALLRIKPEDIDSIEITNPIEIGRTAKEKTFILDIRLLLNNATVINIKMQVADMGDWPDRSVGYLCRIFDRLNHGDDYKDIKPVLHISILDFNIFHDFPEFYASYKLLNVKHHQVYNDKLELRVLQLNRIKNATLEDKTHNLHLWAELFKATTWEEIKMLAHDNSNFASVAQELYKSNADERIRMECEAREDHYRRIRRQQNALNDAQAENTALKREMADLKNEIAALRAENARLKSSGIEPLN